MLRFISKVGISGSAPGVRHCSARCYPMRLSGSRSWALKRRRRVCGWPACAAAIQRAAPQPADWVWHCSLIGIGEHRLTPRLTDVPFDVIGEHAQQNVRNAHDQPGDDGLAAPSEPPRKTGYSRFMAPLPSWLQRAPRKSWDHPCL